MPVAAGDCNVIPERLESEDCSRIGSVSHGAAGNTILNASNNVFIAVQVRSNSHEPNRETGLDRKA